LNDIVGPLLRVLAHQLQNAGEPKRLYRLGSLINWVVKVRGWKAVGESLGRATLMLVPHFPSDIQYLSVLVNILSSPGDGLLSSQDAWELRAVLLLWLALLLTVPFSLAALSPEQTLSPSSLDPASTSLLFPEVVPILTSQVCLIAIPLLHRPGNEGSHAALVLARLYSRPDTAASIPDFFKWAERELEEGDRENEANFVAGLFEMLSLLPAMIAAEYLHDIREFGKQLVEHLRGGRTSASSGLVRKLAVKAGGRWWVGKLSGNRKSGFYIRCG
jgi:hypothetical protein